MSQFIIDDIDALIKEGYGDQGRLHKIKEDYKEKKLVTIDDRKYVEGLMSRYMRPAIEPQPEIIKTQEPRIVPPAPQPKQQEDRFEVKHEKAKQQTIPKIQGKRKLKGITIGIAAVAVVAVLAGYVALNQDGIRFPSVGSPETEPLSVDQESYVRGDIISVTGETEGSASSVRLAITNPAGTEIWNEIVNVRSEGTYSTLVIAGGDGWGQQGEYTMTAAYGNTVNQISFTFSPS